MSKVILNKKFYSLEKRFNEGDFVFCDCYYGYYKLIKFVDSYSSGFTDEKGKKVVIVTKQWVAKKLISKNNKVSICVREIPDFLLRKVTNEEMKNINEKLKDLNTLKKFNETPNEISYSYSGFNGKYKLSDKEIEKLKKDIKKLGKNFPIKKLYNLLKDYKDARYCKDPKPAGEIEYNICVRAYYRPYLVDKNYDHICLSVEYAEGGGVKWQF